MNSIQMFGGGEVWMLRTLQALQQRGHHVWLCCRPGMEVGRRAAETGIPVKLISFRGDFDPITIFHLAWWMKRERIEVVLTNMDKELRLGGIAARIATVPAIIPRRGIDYPLKNRWQYRFAYNTLATIIIANSNATRKALLRHAPWLDPERIEVIYNGVDVQPFLQLSHDTPHNNQNKKFRNLRHEWGIQEKAPLLGFVGQLDKRKGIDVLLSAFHIIRRQVPEARLVLVGRGPLQEMVKNEARNLGWYTPEGDNAVLLPGFIDDVVGVMRAIDVLLLPSFWEGFGIVLIEAMAASKPVISTNTSSMPEIVVDGHTGYLVSPGDTEALASRTIELLQNSVLRERFGRAGCQRAIEYFTLERMIDNLENLFRRQIRERRGFD